MGSVKITEYRKENHGSHRTGDSIFGVAIKRGNIFPILRPRRGRIGSAFELPLPCWACSREYQLRFHAECVNNYRNHRATCCTNMLGLCLRTKHRHPPLTVMLPILLIVFCPGVGQKRSGQFARCTPD